tara:strand:- start:161 stop:481 length:321 start_codon:yes stop_codon:yes gene_type:complete
MILKISKNRKILLLIKNEGKVWLRIFSRVLLLKANILTFYYMWLLAMVRKKSQDQKIIKIPQQRKTTLKWGTNGELSSIDMVRILERLNDQDLTECQIPLETEEKL